MVIDVGARIVVVQLKFGMYFGACFKCNEFGHFARSCPTKQGIPKAASAPEKDASSLEDHKTITEETKICSHKEEWKKGLPTLLILLLMV